MCLGIFRRRGIGKAAPYREKESTISQAAATTVSEAKNRKKRIEKMVKM